MLPASSRLNRTEFEIFLSKKPQNIYNNLGTLKFTKSAELKFSVIVGKKQQKNAVKRNKIRRQIYEIVAKYYKGSHKTITAVLYVSKQAIVFNFEEITQQLQELLKKTTK